MHKHDFINVKNSSNRSFRTVEEQLPYIKDIFVKIKNDCKPFLKEVNEKIVFRGLQKITDGSVGINNARLTDRIPLDTPGELHEYVNILFKQYKGKEWRNGLFTTGDPIEAGIFGRVVAFFPIGNYEYIWHPDIHSLFLEQLSKIKWSYSDYSYMQAEDQGKLIESIKGYYKNTGLQYAIETGNEIIFWCKQYYYVNLISREDYGIKQFYEYHINKELDNV